MILRVENLGKVYKGKTAVEGVSFELDGGRVLAIVGENGAGKTTILKCVVSLRKPTFGTVEVHGKISYVPEGKELYRWASVEQMLEMAAWYSKDFDIEKARRLISSSRIEPSEKIANLSLGERTLLYMAIALAESADVYVLDEPTWGLDPLKRRIVLDEILELSLEGKAVLMSTQIVEDVEVVASDVLVLKEGKVVEMGEVDEIKEKYVLAPCGKGYLYRETSEGRICLVKKEEGIEGEAASLREIVEALMRGERV